MSTKQSYMAHDDAGRQAWLHNYATKINSYAALLGIAAADVTQVENDDTDWAKMLAYQEALKEYKHSITTYKDHLKRMVHTSTPLTPLVAAPALPVFSATFKPDIFGRVAKQVQNLKSNKNYSDTIGKDLGIIGADPYPTPTGGSTLPTERTAELKPIFKIKLNKGNHPWIKWEKGHTHALRMMVDRGDGKGFVLVTVATHHTYTDMFSLPAAGATAIWKYKGIYLDKHEDEEGQWSEVAQITVTGV